MVKTQLLFIDESIDKYMDIAKSCNDATQYILYSKHTSKQEFTKSIQEYSNIDRIAFAFHFSNSYIFLDNTSIFSNLNRDFIIQLLQQLNVVNVDFLACGLLRHPKWTQFLNYISEHTTAIVGASNNNTGNIKYGGDWLMESTHEDIATVYFNDNLLYYDYLLGESNFSYIVSNNTIYNTGNNYDGQLGNGYSGQVSILSYTPNTTEKTPTQISCGRYHTIVLMSDGSIYGTGNNGDGELGIDSYDDQYTLTEMLLPDGKTPTLISCGRYHTMVLMSDGSIYGTGDNEDGQLGIDSYDSQSILTEMLLPDGKMPTQISCGDYFTMVLMSDGSMYGTGANWDGQLGIDSDNDQSTLTEMILPDGKTPTRISCGNNFTIVLMSDGSIYGTGDNEYGELGINSNDDQYTLTEMLLPEGKTPTRISCGRYHTMVLMSDGSIYGTGNNENGQLGIDSYDNQSTLTEMMLPEGKTPTQISCGRYHTMVLMSDESIYGTGNNGDGQLGIDSYDSQSILTEMILPEGNTPTRISCGGYYTMVLMFDGSIYGTGDNWDGQLGQPTMNYYFTQLVPDMDISQLYCGNSHAIVLFTNGSIYGTGDNGSGQLGIDSYNSQSTLTEMLLPDGKTPTQISCGEYFTIVLMSDGSIYGTGDNWGGQLGINSNDTQSILTEMLLPEGKTPTQISGGGYHTMVLMSDGSIYGTGNNGDGELGIDSDYNQSTLTEMMLPEGKTPTQISCGEYHTMVLMSDGSIYGTGANWDGQLGIDSYDNQSTLTEMVLPEGKTPTQISCGGNSTIVLMSDGSIYGTGYNEDGQLGIDSYNNQSTLTLMLLPEGKTPTRISCGNNFTMVLMSDNTLYGTGANWDGQLGLGNNTYSISMLTPLKFSENEYATNITYLMNTVVSSITNEATLLTFMSSQSESSGIIESSINISESLTNTSLLYKYLLLQNANYRIVFAPAPI